MPIIFHMPPKPALSLGILVSLLGFWASMLFLWANSTWWKTYKGTQSNFLSTVIFNLDYVIFYGIYCLFIDVCSLHWDSATKETLSWSQKRSKNTFFVSNQWFLCCTDSVQQTSSMEMSKNAKKGTMAKIENHCTKKIRLGYL